MISFIIPCYNSASTIKKAINSILKQNSNIEYEIIIVDDGSTDNTEQVLKCYESDERIKYYIISSTKVNNSGWGVSFNFLIIYFFNHLFKAFTKLKFDKICTNYS